jgi:hypothetical protein
MQQYRLTRKIGEGGMGEVWQATDTSLDREVAIKVLPEGFGADSDRMTRFEREAKAVAALSHPNILAIHDFGVHEGQAYAVMELLHGETLRERLHQGELPAHKTLDYAQQIARGLAAAHERGVVHRDLKPENVFVTRDGLVKITRPFFPRPLFPRRVSRRPPAGVLRYATPSNPWTLVETRDGYRTTKLPRRRHPLMMPGQKKRRHLNKTSRRRHHLKLSCSAGPGFARPP